MEEIKICKDISSRTLRITMVNGTQIKACINIDREPGYDRLSDIVSSDKEPFLILMNATILNPNQGDPVKHPTIFINKEHILWAIPEEQEG